MALYTAYLCAVYMYAVCAHMYYAHVWHASMQRKNLPVIQVLRSVHAYVLIYAIYYNLGTQHYCSRLEYIDSLQIYSIAEPCTHRTALMLI